MNMSNKETTEQTEGASSFKSTSLPQYLTVPDRIFKQMLSRAVEDGEKIVQWIDTDEKLKSIRQLAHLVNLSRYLQLQQGM
jgi:DNA-binding transcriptional regulator YhcF (GntR family)